MPGTVGPGVEADDSTRNCSGAKPSATSTLVDKVVTTLPMLSAPWYPTVIESPTNANLVRRSPAVALW